MFCTSHQILFGDQIKKTETGMICNKCVGEKMSIQSFGGETRGKETTLKTQA